MMRRIRNRLRTIRYRKSLCKGGTVINKGVKLSMSTVVQDHCKVLENTHIIGSTIGRGSIIGYDCVLNNASIGKYCSIAAKVEVIVGIHPEKGFLSTHPAFYSTVGQAGFTFTDRQRFEEIKYADSSHSVVIGNDVWIGFGAAILSGVSIGDGAIIGARALVTRDVEPYSINVGVPARRIGFRFAQEDIACLLELRWWDRDMEWLAAHVEQFEDIRNIGELHGDWEKNP